MAGNINTCDIDLLDVICLEKMGVLGIVDGIFRFTLLGPIRALVHRPSTCMGPSSSSGVAADEVGPSTSAPPLPSSSDIE